MNEHKRFTGNRPSRRDQYDQPYSLSPYSHTRNNTPNDELYLSQGEEWNRRYTDRHDVTPPPEQYPQHQHLEHQHIEEQFESDHAPDRYDSAPDNRHQVWHDRHHSPRDFVEDNWRQTQNHFALNEYDLEHIEFTGRRKWIKTITSYATTTVMIGFVGLMAFILIPDPSPLDVIAMDAHQAERLTKAASSPGNLQSKFSPPTSASPLENSPAETVKKTIESTLAVNETEALESAQSQTSNDAGLTEIPTTNTQPDTSIREATSLNVENNSTLIVQQQWSNIRRSPDIDGSIVTALAAGKTVTKINQTGNWIEIQTNEQPSITGYMYHSTIAYSGAK